MGLLTDLLGDGNGAYPALPAGLFLGPSGVGRTTLACGTTSQPRMGSWVSIPTTQDIDAIRIEATAGGDGSAALTVALYKMSAAGSSTFDRVVKTAAQAATGSGVWILPAAASLTPGLHLVIVEASGFTSTVPTMRVVTATTGPYTSAGAEVLDPRGGVHWIHLDAAAGLPASFTLPTLTDRQYGPVTYLRTA